MCYTPSLTSAICLVSKACVGLPSPLLFIFSLLFLVCCCYFLLCLPLVSFFNMTAIQEASALFWLLTSVKERKKWSKQWREKEWKWKLSICCPLRPLETQGDSNTRNRLKGSTGVQYKGCTVMNVLSLNPIRETLMHRTLLNLDFRTLLFKFWCK